MAFKEWFQKFKPMQLYIMLVLTVIFFTVELIISHFTHSLTLLVDSYHMLCNTIALTGCIITIKKLHPEIMESKSREVADTKPEPNEENQKVSKSVREHENSLKNTFGWARIDILVMLIQCIFLASLCFSVLVEAVQTLIHIDNHDEMHFPLVILMVGAVGLLLNGFCYTLIGGYTFHQGSYLHVTETGEVILERAVTIDSLRKGQRRLSSQARKNEAPSLSPPQRQGVREMIRDIIGCIFVIICAFVVYFTTGHQFAKYLDPVISLVSSTFLLLLSYPYMKESGLILLQTIPADINIDSLRLQLLQAFPDVVNVHDLHVWQFTAEKIISTAHIIFVDPSDYQRINKQITKFFNDQGITQLTIQPEFTEKSSGSSRSLRLTPETTPCLVNCLKDECRKRNCCINEKEQNNTEGLEAIRVESSGNLKVVSEPGTSDATPETSASQPEPENTDTENKPTQSSVTDQSQS